jgi:ATP-dependent protease ClpP protease subunit
MSLTWRNNKRKKAAMEDDNDDTSSESSIITKLPFMLTKNPNSYIYSKFNHVYFNNDITSDTAFELKKELRNVETTIKTISATLNVDPQPIYLHLTTDGGDIHSALSIIDCMCSLTIPIYTVIDGFVASAGTLISIMGEKRYMNKNSYMLIHQLRSGYWGKMSDIEEEVSNLKKLMRHITSIYIKKSSIDKNEIKEILKKDITWNLKECIKYGLVDEEYK